MKLVSCILVLGALALPFAANAEGAMAIARSSGGGFAYGISYNYSTQDEANTHAIQDCENAKAQHGTNGTCEIATTLQNQCLAFAFDENRNYGWARRGSSELAKMGALSNCPVGSSCTIRNVACDGTAQ
jgi:hypothetical protein